MRNTVHLYFDFSIVAGDIRSLLHLLPYKMNIFNNDKHTFEAASPVEKNVRELKRPI